jgi:co-chaperonin GroES (HSP10)
LGSPDSSFDEPWKDKRSDVKYIPTQAEIGDYALFLGKASIEIKIEDKDYLIVSQSAILILIRDDLARVLA